jgi:hypothetical protein
MILADGFPEELYFSNEHDQLITQRVQYDWTPSWCTKCVQFGHVVERCKMGAKGSNLQVDENGFRPLRKAFRPKRGKQDGSKDVPQQASEVVHVADSQDVFPDVAPQAIATVNEQVDSGQQEDFDVTKQITSSSACSLTPKLHSPYLVRPPSLSLQNDFHVLSLEHASEGGEQVDDIALGADPIGGDD